jgi:hypothetical protein
MGRSLDDGGSGFSDIGLEFELVAVLINEERPSDGKGALSVVWAACPALGLSSRLGRGDEVTGDPSE